MPAYDVINEAIIDAEPERVWSALIAEFDGAAAWWVPANTFAPGAGGAGYVGGETHVTVHTKGVGNGGPKLKFTARTTAIDPCSRMLTTYVDGAFRGTALYCLIPVDGGSRTKLWMRFQARPMGILKVLSKVVDVGAAHSTATAAAFASLDELLRRTAPAPVSVPASAAAAKVTVGATAGVV
jgi:uncharacterized protein YndB with AHSA1/START domain